MKGETRQKVYEFLIEYITEFGYAPSIREICEGVGLNSTSTVYSHLYKLEEEGKIKIRGNSPRAISIVGYEFVKRNEEDESEVNGNEETKNEGE